VKYCTTRDALILRSADLELPFVTHNDGRGGKTRGRLPGHPPDAGELVLRAVIYKKEDYKRHSEKHCLLAL
jgi:hypothetical protein